MGRSSAAAVKQQPQRDLEESDRIARKVLKAAGENIRAESERLRKLGIIDEHGKSLKKPPERKPEDGSDFGGWG